MLIKIIRYDLFVLSFGYGGLYYMLNGIREKRTYIDNNGLR